MSSIKHSITRSFIIIPLVATTLSMSAFTAAINTAVTPTLSQDQQSAAAAEPASDVALLQKEREEKAAKIDAYFEKNGMPLAGYGMKMVTEAELHDIDWRLIPAIAIRESTGGLHQCKSVTYSPFGFGSCRINFKSYDHAIEIVATNLGGDNPKTARHYEGKSTKAILQAYNPPSVVPTYANEVMSLMTKIDNTKV
ncbi:MAG: hypothetical protein V4478_02530 [Patescibacteria group bacterium]